MRRVERQLPLRAQRVQVEPARWLCSSLEQFRRRARPTWPGASERGRSASWPGDGSVRRRSSWPASTCRAASASAIAGEVCAGGYRRIATGTRAEKPLGDPRSPDGRAPGHSYARPETDDPRGGGMPAAAATRSHLGNARLGLPPAIRACLFDLDGVLTRTARCTRRPGRRCSTRSCASARAARGEPFVPFDPVADYERVRRRQAALRRRALVPRVARHRAARGTPTIRRRGDVDGSATGRTSSCSR